VPARITAAPLVLLHGGTVAASGYFAALVALAAERPVVLYDHLDATCLHDPADERARTGQPDPDRLAAFLADMAAIASGVPFPPGPQSICVMGHSWGTPLALAYVLERPDHVAGLILDLIDPPHSSVRGEDGLARRPSLTNRLLQLKMSGHLHEIDLPALLITDDQHPRHAAVAGWFRSLLSGCAFLTLPRTAAARPGEDPRFLEAVRGFLQRAEMNRAMPQAAPDLARAA
jgi:pimeloyl-ACP methyl ester carboxylesterase